MSILALVAVVGCTSSASVEAGGSTPSFLSAARAHVPEPFTGTIVEVLDVPGYTYVNVVDPDGHERWVVSLGKELAVDTPVSVRPFGELEDFHSARADRHFNQMIFAIVSPRSL